MQIEVEPVPKGTAFWLVLGVVAGGVALTVSYLLGQRSGRLERPASEFLEAARERVAKAGRAKGNGRFVPAAARR